MRGPFWFACILAVLPLRAATYTAGPGQRYAKPCDAIKAAGDGDTVEISAGEYVNEFCAVTKALTIRGTGGTATMRGTTTPTVYGGQAIWPIDAQNLKTVVLENLAFVNGRGVGNTAGIKVNPDTNTIVRHCVFRGNENGIMASSGRNTIVVQNSEFDNNGTDDGNTHNIYIGAIAEFTISESWSHDSKGGQLLKSRAAKNTVAYSRFDGLGNYVLDFSNGGDVLVIGSLVTKKDTDPKYNDAVINFGREGLTYTTNSLRLVHSTFLNQHPSSRFIIAQPDSPIRCALINSVLQTGPGLSLLHNCAEWAQDGSVIWPLGIVGTDYKPLENSAALRQGVSIPETVDRDYVFDLASEPRERWGNGATAGAYEGTGTPGPLPALPLPTPDDIKWRVISGTLPPGLALKSDGTFTGAPTTSGTFTFTIEGSVSGYTAGSKTFTLTVQPPANAAVAVTTDTLPDAAAGSAYPVKVQGTLQQ